MKISGGFMLSKSCNSKSRETYSIKLQISLYGLNQYLRMPYNRLSEYLVKDSYTNDAIFPWVFMKKNNIEICCTCYLC